MAQDDSKYTKPGLRERIKNVSQQEAKEESLVSGVQERLKWLHKHIRKQVEDIKVGKEKAKRSETLG